MFCPLFMVCPLFVMSAIRRFHCINLFLPYCLRLKLLHDAKNIFHRDRIN